MEQVNVAIADDNERILDLLEEIINMDKEPVSYTHLDVYKRQEKRQKLSLWQEMCL